MISPPQQHLLLGLDLAVAELLPIAEQALQQGNSVVLLASCSQLAAISSLEAWNGLKNQYLSFLTLLFVLRDEPQLYPLLEGELTQEKLALLQPSVFDAALVQQACIAGPEAWVAQQSQALVALGTAASVIEPLAQAADVDPKAGLPADNAPIARQEQAVAVKVTLHGRELQFAMGLDGTTVLDAAEDAGLDLPYSCRGGVCSTCRTRLIQGSVDMIENASLDDWEVENGFVLACQAVPTSKHLHISYDEV